jgi:hypothetical protein
MRLVTIGQAWTVRVRSSRWYDQTRFTVWPDALHPVSDRSLERSSRDWMRPVARDRMRHRVRFASCHQAAQVDANRTRYTVWLDTLHSVSDRSPESSPCDQTCPVARDRTCHRVWSAQRHAQSSGCVTGHTGSTKERTRWSVTLSRARLPAFWTDRTHLPRPITSTTASGHCFSVRNTPDFRHLFSPPA